MCGIVDNNLSSSIGFKGICIFFYLSNEGISLLENASHLGLPIPTVVKKALNQLHDKSENKENENGK